MATSFSERGSVLIDGSRETAKDLFGSLWNVHGMDRELDRRRSGTTNSTRHSTPFFGHSFEARRIGFILTGG